MYDSLSHLHAIKSASLLIVWVHLGQNNRYWNSNTPIKHGLRPMNGLKNYLNLPSVGFVVLPIEIVSINFVTRLAKSREIHSSIPSRMNTISASSDESSTKSITSMLSEELFCVEQFEELESINVWLTFEISTNLTVIRVHFDGK